MLSLQKRKRGKGSKGTSIIKERGSNWENGFDALRRKVFVNLENGRKRESGNPGCQTEKGEKERGNQKVKNTKQGGYGGACRMCSWSGEIVGVNPSHQSAGGSWGKDKGTPSGRSAGQGGAPLEVR